VALKLPHDEDIDLDAVRKEASVWAQAGGHPNILPIIDADVYDEQIVIVSEYAPDGSLTAWLSRHGGKAPSVESAIKMIDGVLAGLEHLHSKNIIHRDLKPDNILLQGEMPRLADFGIARILKTTSPYTTMVSGTPKYMAPEAYKGRRSEQTDLWSVGIILHQLLTGDYPFPQDDPPSLMYAVLTEEPAALPPTTSHQLRQIVAKSLEKAPERRYRSAREMRDAIQGFMHGQLSSRISTYDSQSPTVKDFSQVQSSEQRRSAGLSTPIKVSTNDEETRIQERGRVFDLRRAGVKSEDTVTIDEPVIAININKQFPYVRSDEDLYNFTRSMWRVDIEHANRAKYAFAVYQGIIREVFEIDRWIPVSPATKKYWEEREEAQGREYPPEVHQGRSEFIGKLAPEHIRKKYVGKRMPVKHSQNPIRYINC
jgi:serine/threonine protein kinase